MNAQSCNVTINHTVPGDIILYGATNLTLSGNLTLSFTTNGIILPQGELG